MSQWYMYFGILLCCLWGEYAAAAEHPRLLFDAGHITRLREAVREDPFLGKLKTDIVDKLTAADKRETHPTPCYDYRARNLAALYVLTGKQAYADRAAVLAREICADEKFYNNARSKGLTRASGVMTLAYAYDLCHDAWEEETRSMVNQKLYEGADGLMKSMGRGANHRKANNWQGVRYGASGLAYLAVDGYPDAGEKAAQAYKLLKGHIRANYGKNGWCPEGIGYTFYPWSFFGPFGIAAQRAGLGDLREDLPVTRKVLWTTLVGTVSAPTADGAGLRADLADDNPHYSGFGTLSLGVWYAPQEDRDAFRWMHKYLMPRHMDTDRGGGILSLAVFDEIAGTGTNPGASRLHYTDPSHGIAIFRNRFQDQNDCVVLANACSRQPSGCHKGPDTNTFRIIGLGTIWSVGSGRTGNALGQTNLFPGIPLVSPPGGRGRLHSYKRADDGGGEAVLSGSCMGVKEHRRQMLVDYSDRSGAEAVIVSTETSENGKVWRLNTPEFHKIKAHENGFTLTSPDGASLRAIVVHPTHPTFRTGTFERGGRSGVSRKDKRYQQNKWIEFDVDRDVCVLMVLHRGDAPRIDLQRVLHGATGSIGKLPFAYDLQSGKSYLGESAIASDLQSRMVPLQPKRLATSDVGANNITLRWQHPVPGAAELLVQRKAGEDTFTTIQTLQANAGSFCDESAEPGSLYTYRLLAANSAGRSMPSEEISIRTWDQGTTTLVEDFGSSAAPEDDRIGGWMARPAARSGFKQKRQRESQGGQGEWDGYFATPYIPIRSTRMLLTENVSGDFSSKSAEIRLDIRCQAVTVYRLMLKLADGRWVAGEERHVRKTRSWRTEVFKPAEIKGWRVVNPDTGTITGKQLALDTGLLSDIHGLGIHANWVIHDKWTAVDTIHLRGQNLTITGE